MSKKTYYLAVYGKNQIPFDSKESLIKYFEKADHLFDSIIQDVKFFKMTLFEIPSPLNSENNE